MDMDSTTEMGLDLGQGMELAQAVETDGVMAKDFNR
jgi:hypothetical protein